ncbi:MAG: gliding motility-associated ABC transporter ATP-binding subunit GldA [Cyclobacteriaceae bacterium]
MSIQINNLSKKFGEQWAVRDVSFTVNEGEIVGFLGPNGAGKSTTMKVATGYIPPTEGSVRICGIDVTEAPREAKRLTGYLPEHNPLYLDMYVHEYLQFIGRLYDIPNLRTRVEEMVSVCGLTREQGKKIETLSKGYRQRVGLAQALIHNPQLLILDEPTSGLDPNQLAEIRNLIKATSRDKTVIFSTHIMQEVQALCDRVIVIDRGRIVADDRLHNLLQQNEGKSTIVLDLENPAGLDELAAIEGVDQVHELKPCSYRVVSKKGIDLRSELFRYATEKKIGVVGLKVEERSLENIFKNLTSSAEA